MLRDRNCDKNFERTLLAEISRAKIAARKMHNNRMTGYEDPRAERDFHRAIIEIVSIAYTISTLLPESSCVDNTQEHYQPTYDYEEKNLQDSCRSA